MYENFIGCSGFHYKDWKEKFYPKDLPQNKWLRYYADHFNTVEINNTFYKLPSEKTIKTWKDSTPENFLFTVKANRYFTHMKRLKIDRDFKIRYADFEKNIVGLQEKLGCILWQLPGSFHIDTSRLKSFCDFLDNRLNHVIEFRHKSWFCEEIYDILTARQITFCMVSAPIDLPDDAIQTSPLGYLRLHGKTKWYDYHYSDDELKNWKEKIEQKEFNSVYLYFNNDISANSVFNAKTAKDIFN